MRLTLPHALHYPITIGGLLKDAGDDIERAEPLFSYTYEAAATGTNEDGTPFEYTQKYTSRFESSVDGTLKDWLLREGDVIHRRGQDIAEIDEPCTHDVQFGGLCATCGKDMTKQTYVTAQTDSSRANINMIHDNASLTVSQGEATRVEMEAKRRLIAARKLSLVVDLDQTIIHATVDPTVAEWQKDPDNPNHDAIKDVEAFQLVDEGPGGRGTWYYIKLRPGLKRFLENVAEVYELHIYTMGTRAYAQNIANLVDPERKIFGDRILSRDESGSMVAKNLQRLFPVDTKMVVIIDDRGDVWNWNPNLIKVTPFSFFIGIGDINSSFLPKKPKPPPMLEKALEEPPSGENGVANAEEPEKPVNGTSPPAAADSTSEPNPPTAPNADVSALEQLVAMGGGDNPAVLQEQNAKQDQELATQLSERPLLQKQKELDAEEEYDSESDKPRHHLLNDNDTELYFLERSLKRVHSAFFADYVRTMADHRGGRLAELRGSDGTGKRKTASADTDLELIPDIKSVMPAVKKQVLAGVTIVFSGIIPLGTDPNMAEIVIHARSFGARVSEVVSRRSTTHVVAMRNRTAKVKQAARRGKGAIKVVNINWLLDSLVQWEKLEESPYLLRLDDADDHGRSQTADGLDGLDDDDALSQSDSHPSGADTDVDLPERHNGQQRRPGLSLRTDLDTDEEEDFEALLPSDLPEQNSPVAWSPEDWTRMRAEMDEMLGSEAGDSDDDDDDDDNNNDNDTEIIRNEKAGASGGGGLLQPPDPSGRRSADGRSGKRSHADMTGSDSDGSVASSKSGRSSRPRKKPAAVGKASQLSNGGGPEAAGDAGKAGADGVEGEDDASEHGWSDFDEAELEAELGRDDAEDAS